MTNKSAQGLSLNTIVLGAIVLIVLTVLIGIFTGYFGNFVPDFKAATEQGCSGLGYKKVVGDCAPDLSNGYNYEQVYARFKEGALEEDQVCCKSSCEALGGVCQGACPSGTALPKGNGGCSAGLVCCKG